MPLETPCTASSAVLQILFEEGADANARAMRERAYTTADSMTNVVECSKSCRCCAFGALAAAAAAALKQGHEGGGVGGGGRRLLHNHKKRGDLAPAVRCRN